MIARSMLALGALLLSAGLNAADTPAPTRVITVSTPNLQPAPTSSKVICKRDIEIGSLVKGVRRCGTREEWKRSEEAARRWTADIQADKGRYNPDGLAVDAAAIAPTNG